MRHVVAGVDDEIRLELGERADPVHLPGLAGCDVHVAQVQHPQRRRTRRQHWHLVVPQSERLAFITPGVSDRPGAGGNQEERGGDFGAHRTMLANSYSGGMTLKERLRDDLTVAIKARDEV